MSTELQPSSSEPVSRFEIVDRISRPDSVVDTTSKTVYFLVKGSFGDNLFQYFAAEIIKKIYHYEDVKPTFHINLEFNTVINDEQYTEITLSHMSGQHIEINTSRPILLMGQFQQSDILEFEMEYLKGLYNEDNQHRISNRIKICNIVKYKTKCLLKPGKNDITLHLDFSYKSYDIQKIKHIIRSTPHSILFVIVTKTSESSESSESDEKNNEYSKELEEFKPFYFSGNLGDEFDFMLHSPTLITSASSMSYMAGYLGNANAIHLFYKEKLGGFSEKCIVH
jgi:hypothetical protein